MAILNKRPPRLKDALFLGSLLGVSFLIREANYILHILYWPFIAYWVYQAKFSITRSFGIFLLFITPLFLLDSGYKSWNYYRSGESFVTTAGQTTVFFPSLNLMSEGIFPYKNDRLLKDFSLPPETAFMPDPMGSVYKLNAYLNNTYKMNSTAIAQYAFESYFKLWRSHPTDMLRITAKEIDEKQVFAFFMPIEAALTLDFWYRNEKFLPKRKVITQELKKNGRIDLVILYIAKSISRAIASIIAMWFLIGVPIYIVYKFKHHGAIKTFETSKTVILALLWLFYVGYTLAYALVHMEVRYLAPITPFGAILGVYLLSITYHRLNLLWKQK